MFKYPPYKLDTIAFIIISWTKTKTNTKQNSSLDILGDL